MLYTTEELHLITVLVLWMVPFGVYVNLVKIREFCIMDIREYMPSNFKQVGAPNGLCINLFGPVEGRRHDSGMLADSGLLPLLQIHAVSPIGGLLCIYGDPAYPHRPQLQAPFKGARLTPMEEEWNKSMSKVRI